MRPAKTKRLSVDIPEDLHRLLKTGLPHGGLSALVLMLLRATPIPATKRALLSGKRARIRVTVNE